MRLHDNALGLSTINGNRTDCTFFVQNNEEVMRLRVDLQGIYNIHGITIFTESSSKYMNLVYDNFDLVHRYPIGSANYEVTSVKTQGSQHSRDTKILSTHY